MKLFKRLFSKPYRDDSFKKSNAYNHAISEFKIAGYKPIEECEDDPNKWIQENVLELLEVFYKQGHSGFSANYCVNCFKTLAMFDTLSPIMCSEDEFSYSEHREDMFQNKRLSSIFKNGKNGRPYYLDAIVWKEQNGNCFSGTVSGISSRQYIKDFPFTPKTFYIDVLSWEVNKDTNEPENGSGWWESRIKDMSQLDEVWEYYNEFKQGE